MTLLDHLAHGAHHMPGTALAMRVLVITFSGCLALMHSDPWFGALTGAASLAAGVITLAELRAEAADCDNANRPEDGETGFGEAA